MVFTLEAKNMIEPLYINAFNSNLRLCSLRGTRQAEAAAEERRQAELTVGRCRLKPTRPVLKAPGSLLLKLRYDGLLSNCNFHFNLHRYITDDLFDSSSAGKEA